MDEIK